MNELNLEYEEVQFKPNSTVFDFKTKRKDIFVYGSVKLAKVAAEFDWHPGSFYGNNHKFKNYSAGYGANLINHGSFICTLIEKIDWSKSSSLFIKPSEEAKIFTGKVFNQHQWNDFIHFKLNDPTEKRITERTKIQISEPYHITKEARIWIVGKKVVTSSYYRFHGNAEYEENVSQNGLEFAQKMAETFNVADAYVMDIAFTLNEWKIMEINCINSAGFYKGDVKKIILALEELYEKSTKYNNGIM